MSDSNKHQHGQVYEQQDFEENGDNNDSQQLQQDEGSQQQNQSSENHNEQNQQQDNQDINHQERKFIEDNEEQQEEERVVRAQKQPHVQDNLQQLQHQASNHSAKEKIKDFSRQGNIKEDDDNQQQQKRDQQKQEQIHQQKSFQGQQSFKEPQQSQRQKQKSQQDTVLFSQFLNEMLESYRTTQSAFKAIDRHNKGFFEVKDLAIVLADKFGIESESQQQEIFVKIGNGNDRINRQIFDAAFQDIVNEKHQQQQQLFSSMNVVTENFDPSHSPFKDKQERDDIINIFSNDKEINLEEANKIEHFSEDCMYAPVIRRLRQQPNFNEFVRSYNSLQFPKISQSSQNNTEENYKPFSQLQNQEKNQISFKQQKFIRHEIFSNPMYNSYNGAQSLLDEYKQSTNPLNTLSGSPSRQLKTTSNTFSPNRFYSSLDIPRDTDLGKNLQNLQVPRPTGSSGARFLSPQYNRNFNSSYLGFDYGSSIYQSQVNGNQLKQSQGNLNFNFASNKQNRDHMNSSKMFSYQDSDFLQRSNVAQPNQGLLTFGAGNPLFQSINTIPQNTNANQTNNLFDGHSSQLAQSSYLGIGGGKRIDLLRQSPNQKRLKQLKRQVNVGVENIQQVNRQSIDQNVSLNQSYTKSNNQSKVTKEQINQYLSQLGGRQQRTAQASPQRFKGNYRSVHQQRNESERFGDILSRLQGNARVSNRSLEKRRYNRKSNQDIFGAVNASPFRSKSQDSPVKFKLSPTGTNGGVHGQMQRVRQIQASLRALPNKRSVRFQRNYQKNKDFNYYDKKSQNN